MMRPMTLSELAAPLSATLLGSDRTFTGVSTDSRSIAAGDLFVALAGENFDGHAYLQQVAAAGAVGAVVSKPANTDLSLLQVDDSQRALGLVGAYNRALYEWPLVAVTGSSGKTSVKNMISAILSRRGETLATEGNFNNEVGVPLTLLRLEPRHQFAVVEMGAARGGDIAWLCQLGKPTIAMVLNAMAAHLDGFGSVEDVAVAKGEIYDGLGASDIAVINADQPWAAQWRERAAPARIIDFATERPAVVTAQKIIGRGIDGTSFTAVTPLGEFEVALAVPGRHNVANALAAIAVGVACELQPQEIAAGLANVRAVGGRLATRFTAAGTTVIDDCYNANPGSVRAAIDLLASCPGRRTLVLGEMRELGPGSMELHRQMGEYASTRGIDRFWGVGSALASAVSAFGHGGTLFEDRQEAITAVPSSFEVDDTVLIKGSRGAGMELVLAAFDSVPVREIS